MKDKVMVLVGRGQHNKSTIKKAIEAIIEKTDIEIVDNKTDVIEIAGNEKDIKDIISLSLYGKHMIENNNNIYLPLTNDRKIVNDKYMHPTQKQLETLRKHNSRRKK